MIVRTLFSFLLACSCFATPAAEPLMIGPPGGASLGAEIFARVHPAVVVLRTRLAGSERDTSSGSGFLVAPDGRAITNYHVVAEYLFEPKKFALTYQDADGATGTVQVVAVDVLNDLAVVALQNLPVRDGRRAMLALPDAAQSRTPQLGEAVFAFGNPLDLGVTISAGSYSGVVPGTFDSRIHFTGSLNPGMSGGPAVDRAGRLVGINVARAVDGQSVSFLVPGSRATELFARTHDATPLRTDELRHEVGDQLRRRDAYTRELALATPWRQETLGGFLIPAFLDDYMECSSGSNDSTSSPPPARTQTISCTLKTSAAPIPNTRSATQSYRNVLVQARSPGTLNAFQLTAIATPAFNNGMGSARSGTMARQRCADRYTQAGPRNDLPVRLVWCAQAYRDFPGIYDIQIALAAQDSSDAILVSRISLEGVTWPTALAYTNRLLVGTERQ